MRKIFIFAFLFLLCLTNRAQDKKFLINIEIEQNIGLNKRFDNPEINRPLQKNNSTDLKVGFNWRCYKNWGVYSDISLCLYHYNKDYEQINIFNEYNLDNYYLKDQWFDDSGSLNPGIRITFGIFHKFKLKKLDIMPHLGFGYETINTPQNSYTLKEKGTNAMYKVDYEWFPRESTSEYNMKVLALQLKSAYKISNFTNLTFGINYRYYLNKPEFGSRITDYYNGKLMNETTIRGNNVHSLSISMGILFGW